MLSPVCGRRIVARFGCEGKPDNARKSRIFNNLGHPRWRSDACGPDRSAGQCRKLPLEPFRSDRALLPSADPNSAACRYRPRVPGTCRSPLIYVNRGSGAAQRMAVSQRKIYQGRLTAKRTWLSRSVAGKTRPFADALNPGGPGGDDLDDHHTGIGRGGAWLVS